MIELCENWYKYEDTFELNLNQNTKHIFQYNVFENVARKMAAILSINQCVEPIHMLLPT